MGGAPARWRCRSFSLDLARPLVMGILNVTPDSFSDGGAYADSGAAVAAGARMLAEGAAIIDVGGESTRPGSDPVSAEEELARVLPVVRALAGQGACVSVDSRRARVATASLAAGASIVNDVSGFSDPEMVRVAAGSDAGLIVMHMRGEPKTMQSDPVYADVVAEVAAYLARQAEALESASVARDRIAVDPGIGFGKTTEHNLALLRRLDGIASLGYPVVVGASRKRFIGEITGVAEPRDRLAGSVAAAVLAVANGARVVRVHDVAATVQALAVRSAIAGEDGGR
jgi:dihydropteroate synthase